MTFGNCGEIAMNHTKAIDQDLLLRLIFWLLHFGFGLAAGTGFTLVRIAPGCGCRLGLGS